MRGFGFIFLFPIICLSQQTIDAEQFFNLGLANHQGTQELVREEVNFPLIERYEFRTETSEFDFNEQEYTVRLSPSTGKIRKAQKAYYEEMLNAPDIDGQEIYCDLKFSLHIDWLSLFILNEHKGILDEMMVILNDKQSTLEKMLGSYEFDSEKLVKLQTENTDLEVSLNNIKLEQAYLLKKYNLQNQNLIFTDFISMEDLQQYLSQDLLAPKQSELVDLESSHEKQLLEREIALESSEEKKLVDFVQLKYNGPHTDMLKERLSVGLGFQLNTSGNAKLKMQKLRIEMDELNRESNREIQKRQEKIKASAAMLQSDMESFSLFKKLMEEERAQLQKLSNNISQKEGTSPLLLLDIEKRHLIMKMKSLNRKEDLLRDYLEYLLENDRMCQSQFVNYLN